jgi:hypothetical protein
METVKSIDGVLIHDVPPGGITSISFPGVTETIIRKHSHEDGATIHALSGPDLNGRVVYVEDHMMKKTHSLKVASLSGNDHEAILTHSGDALWDHSIGESLALSATGGLVATVGPTTGVQMHDPMALLMEGSIEIWSIEDRSQQKLNIAAIDRGLSWFPDSKQIAYCGFAPREEILSQSPGAARLMGQYEKWDRVPTIFVHNLETSESRRLMPGWFPLVSPDGKSVLATGLPGTWPHLINLETMEVKDIYWTNGLALPIGFVSPGQILYRQTKSPTLGEKLAENLPFVDRKSKASIGILDVTTMETQEVMVMEPHMEMSYGKMRGSEE